jgi:hypothetical protein
MADRQTGFDDEAGAFGAGFFGGLGESGHRENDDGERSLVRRIKEAFDRRYRSRNQEGLREHPALVCPTFEEPNPSHQLKIDPKAMAIMKSK